MGFDSDIFINFIFDIVDNRPSLIFIFIKYRTILGMLCDIRDTDIWKFLEALQREQSLMEVKTEQLFSGMTFDKRKKKYRESEIRLRLLSIVLMNVLT